MTTSERIKDIRQQKGLSQKELGKLLGVSQQMVGQWESPKANLTLDTITKIATVLNVNINDLLESPLDDSPLYKVFKNASPSDYPMGRRFINAELTIQIDDWQQVDIELVKKFKKLNEAGKTIAIERIEELTEIPRYTKKDEENIPDKDK